MNDVITVVQGSSERHFQVFYDTVQILKWIFPYLPGVNKDLVSVKKIQAGRKTGPV